ncbi:hypothetical protein [Lacipirellula sp.]|uniref:hypothetical protein n=1 Tax=Lacipirellula sp. TaxID=2691419 RepID=UPI003D09DAA1
MPKKSTILQWTPLLALWLAMGVYGRMKLRAEIGHPNYGDACIDVFLTGGDQSQQAALVQCLNEEFAGNTDASIESHAYNVPLLRTGLVKLSYSKSNPLDATFVADKIERRFPDIQPAIFDSVLAKDE